MRITSIASTLACALLLAAPLTAQSPERPALSISGYVIDAEIDPATHHLAAKAVVTFTAPENSDAVSFGFHPALKITNISDEAGTVLTGERSPDGGVRITPATPFVPGQAAHWSFEYGGTITGNDDGPIEGLKLAAIQEP
ncbi:MAG: peptidase M1, partial [Terracidiphilus sp.]